MATITASLSNFLMIAQVLCSALEIIINKALSLNSADISLESFEQKTLTIELAELSFPLSFTANDNKILVRSLTEHSDCTVTTSLSVLRKLKAESDLTSLIKQNKLDIIGDIKLAQKFAALVENLNIDWQSELAKHIGDVTTYKLTQLGKKITKKITAVGQKVQNDTNEYIVHEQRLLVTKNQIDRFNDQVDSITIQVDKAAMRIEQLEKRIKHN